MCRPRLLAHIAGPPERGGIAALVGIDARQRIDEVVSTSPPLLRGAPTFHRADQGHLVGLLWSQYLSGVTDCTRAAVQAVLSVAKEGRPSHRARTARVDRMVSTLAEQLPEIADYLDGARTDILASSIRASPIPSVTADSILLHGSPYTFSNEYWHSYNCLACADRDSLRESSVAIAARRD